MLNDSNLIKSIIKNYFFSTVKESIAKSLLTVPIVTHNPTLFFLSFWHLEQVYWERQIPCVCVCGVFQCSVCNLRGVYISIVNQTKQRLCQWCKHRELNLLQFTTRSSSANLTVQEIKSLLNYSICFPCRAMRADIIYNWRFSRL